MHRTCGTPTQTGLGKKRAGGQHWRRHRDRVCSREASLTLAECGDAESDVAQARGTRRGQESRKDKGCTSDQTRYAGEWPSNPPDQPTGHNGKLPISSPERLCRPGTHDAVLGR
ncbi:hypothetical protein NOVOSPHI9U_160002 [Novosphingobium sp. 9U]|nr:hypothetical protein NOVOSPHI9U_160002 [Novosphingobium sp. 9U]